MSWEDFVSHILITSSKVRKIAVLDNKGRPIALSAGTEISQSEGQALINCVLDPIKLMTKLIIDNDVYVCVQGIGNTCVGTSAKKSSNVIVARQDGDYTVVVFGQSGGQGSFMFEIKQGLLLREQGQLVGQQQQQTLPINPNVAVDVGGAVGSEQVLVDLAG